MTQTVQQRRILRSFVEGGDRPAPTAPKPTKCHQCGTVAAENICHICKQPRQHYATLVARGVR